MDLEDRVVLSGHLDLEVLASLDQTLLEVLLLLSVLEDQVDHLAPEVQFLQAVQAVQFLLWDQLHLSDLAVPLDLLVLEDLALPAIQVLHALLFVLQDQVHLPLLMDLQDQADQAGLEVQEVQPFQFHQAVQLALLRHAVPEVPEVLAHHVDLLIQLVLVILTGLVGLFVQVIQKVLVVLNYSKFIENYSLSLSMFIINVQICI